MRRLSDEDGAIAVIVALLLTVLLGMAALVIDVGAIYQEKRELQNGADAGALAFAEGCAGGVMTCAMAVAQDVAGDYANLNADDGASDAAIDPADFDPAGRVTVITTTRSEGNAFLSFLFAPVLGTDTGTVEARATAIWGRYGGGITMPIAICERNWDTKTASGSLLPSGPPSHVIRFATSQGGPSSTADDCTNPAEDTYSGGFGFLARDANCMTISTVDASGETWVEGKAGNNLVDPSSECDQGEVVAMMRDRIDEGREVLIPIFDAFRGSGGSGEFRIVGYAGFKLEGFKILAGGPATEYGMGPGQCTGNASCLKGYYTRFVAVDGELSDGGAGDFGATIVRLIS